MNISVITPSIRKELLQVVYKCLLRQDFEHFEWIVVSPFEYAHADIWLPEPKRNKGDFYGLNKAWNEAIRAATGDLIVSIVDGLWFNPRLLSHLWNHYLTDNTKCIGLIGNQYEKMADGKPEMLRWADPRRRGMAFYQVDPIMFELCIASIPKKGMYEVGGFDEEYDKGAAVSEKELCKRLEKVGYTFWTDETIEYRALYHPRIGGTEEWDKHYITSCVLYDRHLKEIANGTRKKLDFLE